MDAPIGPALLVHLKLGMQSDKLPLEDLKDYEGALRRQREAIRAARRETKFGLARCKCGHPLRVHSKTDGKCLAVGCGC